MDLQYKAIGIDFITADTLDELKAKITEALAKDQLFHGDWRVLPDGKFCQAMCPADWRPVPLPPGAAAGLALPGRGPGRIIG